jgi:hypothetical protein
MGWSKQANAAYLASMEIHHPDLEELDWTLANEQGEVDLKLGMRYNRGLTHLRKQGLKWWFFFGSHRKSVLASLSCPC